MNKLFLLAALFAAPALSQELTHPRAMGLPDSNYTRPDPAEFQLALENGLIAYVAAADQVPLVTMSAFIRTGKVNDEKQATAESLLDALKNSGPSGMDSADFNAALKRMAAEFTVEMHDEWTEITLNVPAEDIDQALLMFAGLLRNPAISGANIEHAAAEATPAPGDLGGESAEHHVLGVDQPPFGRDLGGLGGVGFHHARIRFGRGAPRARNGARVCQEIFTCQRNKQ